MSDPLTTNDQPEMAGIDIRDDTLRRNLWRRANCPICRREYLHLIQYECETCQTLACAFK